MKRIGCIGDVHLACLTLAVDVMISRLIRHFVRYIKTLDMLVINGDWYDRPIPHDSREAHAISILNSLIIRECAKHDVVLRVMRGTPGHDGDQCQNFVTLYEALKLHMEELEQTLDFKYHDTLTIETIDGIGSCLFLPDKFGSCPSDAYDQIYQKLQALKMEQVDFIFLHGGFEYQLPYSSEAHPSHHDSEAYLDITRNRLFNNHIHTPSIHDRLLGPGSFDRIRHGEEHPKGWLIYEYDEKDPINGEAIFMENKEASLFKTLHITDNSIDAAAEQIDVIIGEGYKNGFIRLIVPESHPLLKHLKPLQQRYKSFVIKVEKSSLKKIKANDIFGFKPVVRSITLDRMTLPKLVLDSIPLSAEHRKKEIEHLLKEVAIQC